MASAGSYFSFGLVVGSTGRLRDWRRITGGRDSHRICSRGIAFFTFRQPVFISYTPLADCYRGVVRRRSFGGRGNVQRLSAANLDARATGLVGDIAHVGSFRCHSFAQPKRSGGIYFCEYGAGRSLAGDGVSTYAKSLVSAGCALGLELGARFRRWSAG